MVTRGKIWHTLNATLFLWSEKIIESDSSVNDIRYTFFYDFTQELSKKKQKDTFINDWIEVVRRNKFNNILQHKTIWRRVKLRKYLCKIHKYLFITNFKLVQTGFIFLYQEILNNLNHDSAYEITNNRR